jgi:DNA recombination protein RmuC
LIDLASVLALAISIVSFLVILYILIAKLSPNNLKKIYGESLRSTLSDTSIVKDQFKASVAELKIDADIRAIIESTNNILSEQASLTEIFKNKSSRGYFGEKHLENILKDHLGSGWIHVREKISPDIEIPDIYFDTPQGKLCIDSKFPLENYQRIIKAKDEKEKSSAVSDFNKDFSRHVKKVAGYIRPESGTARIALMYLPAESIYAYVSEEHPDWMDLAAKSNVLIVSPSSIIPQLTVIRSYVEAERILKHTDDIKRKIDGYQRDFHEIFNEWKTLHTHIDNAKTKADGVDAKIGSFASGLDTLLSSFSNSEKESETDR